MSATVLDAMIEAAIAAADVIMAVYATPFSTITKPDGSPVTEADRRAEAIILDRLAPLGIPVLGEESAASGRVPALGRRYFAVDPVDGTKEFIKRNGEFSVNIGLVENGRAVLGVVLAPASGEGFHGGAHGAFTFRAQGGKAGPARPIHVNPEGPMRIVASRSHGHAALAPLAARLGMSETVHMGSSLKTCVVARGDAQLYPRIGPTWEWDTAAGQAILEAAGGALLTVDGAPLTYGARGDYLNPSFVAASTAELARRAAAAIRELAS